MKIGRDEFLIEVERKKFLKMLSKHGKAFVLTVKEIGCINPSIVISMIIFTILHVLWDLKPILVPKALLLMLVDLLKEKVKIGIFKPSIVSYSNQWFIMPKKSEVLTFIQDMQSTNKVAIMNIELGPVIDEVPEAFLGLLFTLVRIHI